jgi:GTP cyclohydrolase II
MKIVRTTLATEFGIFDIARFRDAEGESCLVIAAQRPSTIPIVRIHCACFFGEALHSLHCECRQQWEAALRMIQTEGGLIIYLEQEGRGIGLDEKIRAMEIERSNKISTAEAFQMLGYPPDTRNYNLAISAIKTSGMGQRFRVITNNPHKIKALEDAGFEIVERIEPALEVSPVTAKAVREKQRALKHILYKNFIVKES